MTVGEIDKIIDNYKNQVKTGKKNKHVIYKRILDSDDNEFIKRCIERRKELDIFIDSIYVLIGKINEFEYTKKCLENWKNLIPNAEARCELIAGTENIDYMKECIKNSDQLELGQEYVVRLIIEIGEDELKKEYLEKERLSLDNANTCYLIENIENVEDKKNYIENWKKYKLDAGDVLNLIQGMYDPEYAKECIERRNELDINTEDIDMLITEIDDVKYIKQCIKNRNKFNFNSRGITRLICYTNDKRYMKNCVRNRKKYGIETSDLCDLIIQTDDIEFVKDCVEKRYELDIDQNYLFDLISYCNIEYVKECIDRRKELGITKENVFRLIKCTRDLKYIRECIRRREEYEIDIKEELKLLLLMGDMRYMNSRVEEILKEMQKQNTQDKRRVKLPKDMTIGIEIEAEGELSNLLYGYLGKFPAGWDRKPDSSLANGIEISSPIIKGNNKRTPYNIRKMCNFMKLMGLEATDRCGGHVHIGANYLNNKKAWENLTEIWTNTEELLFIISNKEGEVPRIGFEKYARPISKKIEKELNRKSVELKSQKDVQLFIKHAQDGKWHSINFKNIGDKDKNTIEFRLANGTLDENTWVENINLYGGIVKAAKDLSIIQEKNKEELSSEDMSKLDCLEIIKNEEASEIEKLNALLELCVDKEDKQIYTNRYDTNKVLLENDPETKKLMKTFMAESSIDINKIGKKVFLGDDTVTGQEYEQYIHMLKMEKGKQNNKENHEEGR